MDGLKMKYFVLNPTKDDHYGQASRQALRAYALSIAGVNPSLADDLRKWASDEETDRSENNKKMQSASD